MLGHIDKSSRAAHPRRRARMRIVPMDYWNKNLSDTAQHISARRALFSGLEKKSVRPSLQTNPQ